MTYNEFLKAAASTRVGKALLAVKKEIKSDVAAKGYFKYFSCITNSTDYFW